MSGWTHAICDRCWAPWCLGKHGYLFEPVRFKERSDHWAICCICGDRTDSGAFIRGDPDKFPCYGKGPQHPEEVA